MRAGQSTTPTLDNWIIKNFNTGDSIGFDPYQMSISQYKELKKAMKAYGIILQPLFCENLVDQIWKLEKHDDDNNNNKDEEKSIDGDGASDIYPGLPKSKIFLHEEIYSGLNSKTKIQELRNAMEKNNSYLVVVSAQDEIAWQFNLRGNDVEYNPVFLSYALITQDKVILCVDNSRFNDDVNKYLNELNIEVRPYDSIQNCLIDIVNKMINDTKSKDKTIWMDETTTSVAQMQSIQEDIKNVTDEIFYLQPTPITQCKAIKNTVELNGMKECHIRDSAALVQYLAWQDDQQDNVPTKEELQNSNNSNNNIKLNEVTAADVQREYRSKKKLFMDISFSSISSMDENGAVIHYNPSTNPSPKPITSNSIYLIDSGGHYKDGTTDVTRTVFLSKKNSNEKPTDHQKKMYTQVLKGHLQLGHCIFPPSTIGPSLDILARKPLWDEGLDYLHGTGHGVGSYLNVHEGPQGIAPGTRQGPLTKTPLCPNMILSNEPGYYEDGSFGIRLENLVYVQEKKTNFQFNGRIYLGFDDLTLVPYDRKQIDINLLTKEECNFVNEYHTRCFETLKDELKDDQRALDWLQVATRPL